MPLGPVQINDRTSQQLIEKQLKYEGYKVIPYYIDIQRYNDYLKTAKYEKYQQYYQDITSSRNFAEKTLEHYICSDLLDLKPSDVFIDIASGGSPVYSIYKDIFKCKTLRQDMFFPSGYENNTIGGKAEKLPCEKKSITKMGLCCSFEHFEEKSDMLFINEANRVLKPGGRLCIVPLYLHTQYAIQTDSSKHRDIIFESDAIIYDSSGWGQRHGRFYDIPHLNVRIKKYLKKLKLKIFIIQNEKNIHESCYVKFVALFEKRSDIVDILNDFIK